MKGLEERVDEKLEISIEEQRFAKYRKQIKIQVIAIFVVLAVFY